METNFFMDLLLAATPLTGEKTSWRGLVQLFYLPAATVVEERNEPTPVNSVMDRW
jgi:hypothetical protein